MNKIREILIDALRNPKLVSTTNFSIDETELTEVETEIKKLVLGCVPRWKPTISQIFERIEKLFAKSEVK